MSSSSRPPATATNTNIPPQRPKRSSSARTGWRSSARLKPDPPAGGHGCRPPAAAQRRAARFSASRTRPSRPAATLYRHHQRPPQHRRPTTPPSDADDDRPLRSLLTAPGARRAAARPSWTDQASARPLARITHKKYI